MAEREMVTIATVDEAATEAIEEALEDAGIPLDLVALRPFKQLEYLRHQHRPLVDIDVEASRAEEAKAVLDRFAADAEIAALSESGAESAELPSATRALDPDQQPLKISHGIAAAMISKLIGLPLGCLYAREPRAAMLLCGVVLGAVIFAFTGEANEKRAYFIVASIWVVDLVLTVLFVMRHNRRLAAASRPAGDGNSGRNGDAPRS